MYNLIYKELKYGKLSLATALQDLSGLSKNRRGFLFYRKLDEERAFKDKEILDALTKAVANAILENIPASSKMYDGMLEISEKESYTEQQVVSLCETLFSKNILILLRENKKLDRNFCLIPEDSEVTEHFCH